ncbi:MAG: hypothetical protein A3I88_01930 [Candidatus Portnoybacteria bacterium RIFCSPLOWO2_12_FULL_39_9]|uniref:R3H domain-containing protein n=1 Tax=Candidatus Portnoybacteria bacterium RIFCSPHIGHO2_12_FULL_38_9 TaxID=1801997 RepID=A0A1G2FIR1_9BACT|nr:MAG: hypothetical protein A3H00_01210 [Candidatus Portnoybacteria bacterium RBG_13_40_8]OGZ36574.1 MAG: hypothetical protein A2646_00110 [Candidatus Portnoybacteria bacterium RIFCSPHIGHO2_02_FULL_39_12]OGZ37468.1 MAG: hypothetical protein A3J64_00535 [Candidatus Portnoybacteria bacterium RIFCSPHIGHO2_12_FULL_38_9]OGZ39114.1 MAG: hypothetical protein A3F21_00110 [Candidatus Portnoybacteria bacterium RIFCSPLOWO2_01_FULL_38_39]OGZ40203.1 MAG: hypothetical protein A3I88_01930 [Candidatus Portnoy
MDNSEIIQQTIKELLEKIRLEADISIDASDDENIMVNIKTDEASFLIGRAGETLQALQHLARVLVNKKLGAPLQFILDINHYQSHRIEFLKELANDMANRALNDKTSLFLQPMSAHERRIIHLVLANHSQIETESTGEEPNRRVVIKPKA